MSITRLGSRLGRAVYLATCGLVFTFLLLPLLVIVPLSFNAEPYFTFTEGMLHLDPDAFSLRWYRQVADDAVWVGALGNSLLNRLRRHSVGDRVGHARRPGVGKSCHASAPPGDGATDVADGHTSDHLGGGDVLLLLVVGFWLRRTSA